MREKKSVNITFRVAGDFKKMLAEFCEQGDLSSSFVIRRALASYLNGKKEAGAADKPALPLGR